MLKFTKTTKVYEYMELSDDAKENAKQWYLNDDSRSYELTDIFMEDIHQIFPNSKIRGTVVFKFLPGRWCQYLRFC